VHYCKPLGDQAEEKGVARIASIVQLYISVKKGQMPLMWLNSRGQTCFTVTLGYPERDSDSSYQSGDTGNTAGVEERCPGVFKEWKKKN